MTIIFVPSIWFGDECAYRVCTILCDESVSQETDVLTGVTLLLTISATGYTLRYLIAAALVSNESLSDICSRCISRKLLSSGHVVVDEESDIFLSCCDLDLTARLKTQCQ